MDEDELRQLMRLYYANITCADRNMGRVLKAIDDLGITDRTLVIFIGDNGFNVGHHGLLGKGNARVLGSKQRRPNMFDRSILVPFIVRWPGVVQPGTSSSAFVATIDILPTLIDITGAKADFQLDGRSMVPLLQDTDDVPWRNAWCDTYDMIYLRESHMRMIRTDHWKLVLHFGEGEQGLGNGVNHELFNLQSDPGELRNVYGTVSVRQVQQDLQKRPRARMREFGVDGDE